MEVETKERNFKCAFLTWLLLAILRKYEGENNLDYFSICFHMVILLFSSQIQISSTVPCLWDPSWLPPISMSWPFPSLLFKGTDLICRVWVWNMSQKIVEIYIFIFAGDICNLSKCLRVKLKMQICKFACPRGNISQSDAMLINHDCYYYALDVL